MSASRSSGKGGERRRWGETGGEVFEVKDDVVARAFGLAFSRIIRRLQRFSALKHFLTSGARKCTLSIRDITFLSIVERSIAAIFGSHVAGT